MITTGLGVSYPRRQQRRRLVRASKSAACSVACGLLGLWLASEGAPVPGVGLLMVAIGSALSARRWISLATRSRVGAQSEDAVRRELGALLAEGWRVRHSLRWRGRGDIDSVAIAPTGIAIAIETKTRSYDERHLARVRDQAAWLARRRRGWAPHGALGVICVVRARGVEQVENDVLVVSLERLTRILHVASRLDSVPPR